MSNHDLAAALAQELRELATACEQAAQGDEKAKKFLEYNMEHRNWGFSVGAGKVQQLIYGEEE